MNDLYVTNKAKIKLICIKFKLRGRRLNKKGVKNDTYSVYIKRTGFPYFV